MYCVVESELFTQNNVCRVVNELSYNTETILRGELTGSGTS